MTRPKVSVAMITFNHERFINAAIESVLKQTRDFDIELILGDDCSTDRTGEIVLDYARKHPDVIRPLIRERNIGMNRNFADVILSCRGEYVALLEGDDRWMSADKLHRQVEFLDSNLDFVMCVHRALVVSDNESAPSFVTRTDSKKDWTLEDVIEYRAPLPTCGTMFRNGLLSEFPEWFFRIHNCDYATQMLLAQYGKVRLMDEPMGIYVKHPGGISEVASTVDQLRKTILLFDSMNEYYQFRYDSLFRKRTATMLRALVRPLVRQGRLAEASAALMRYGFTLSTSASGLLRNRLRRAFAE